MMMGSANEKWAAKWQGIACITIGGVKLGFSNSQCWKRRVLLKPKSATEKLLKPTGTKEKKQWFRGGRGPKLVLQSYDFRVIMQSSF